MSKKPGEIEENIFPDFDPSRLLLRIAETDQIDYKTKFSKDKDDLHNTVKVFAAMANSGGGVVIYGVQKQTLVGIDQDQESLLDPARLNGMLSGILSPVPPLSTEIIEHQGMKFAFVSVGAITHAPVLVEKNLNDAGNKLVLRAGAIFVRDNTESIEVTTDTQVRHVLDRIINFQVRRRLAEILPIFDQKPVPIKEVPTVEVLGRKQANEITKIDSSTPIREAIYLLPGSAKLEREKLIEVFSIRSRLTGLVWPHYAVNTESSKVSASEGGFFSSFGREDGLRKFFARIDPNGSVYSCSMLLEDDFITQGEQTAERFKNGVGVQLSINLIAVAVRLGHEYLTRIPADSLRLRYSLRNIRGRQLLMEDPFRREHPTNDFSYDENISTEIELRKEMKREDLVAASEKIATDIFHGFNWNPHSGLMKSDVETALNSTSIEERVLDSLI